MNKNSPIIILEDDLHDQEMLSEVFKTLNYPNRLLFFTDGQQALDFLTTSGITPFLILSDVNLPKLDGFALRSKLTVDARLEIRCIPYLFFSTSQNQQAVIDAYSMSVQGFFKKPHTISELEDTIRVIMEYWRKCSAPNNMIDPKS